MIKTIIRRSIDRWNNFALSMRPISQVTSTQLIGKKSRATLVFTIFTIILILNVFLSTAAETMTTNFSDQYAEKSNGVDIVINTESADPAIVDISDELTAMDGIDHVYEFRSAYIPVYYDDPRSNSFDPNEDIEFLRVVEVSEEIINPDNDWTSENAMPFSIDEVSEADGYNYEYDMTTSEKRDLSVEILGDFYAGKSKMLDSVELKVSIAGMFFMIDTPMFYDTISDDYVHSVAGLYLAALGFTMTGDWQFFEGSLLMTPDMTANIPAFQNLAGPNLFLVKSENDYFDYDANLELSQQIEDRVNNLAEPTSMSSVYGSLLGATTRIVSEVVGDFWETQSAVWLFLNTFATFGLIIGGAGLAIVAVRSVAERTREIGMMRAIGFSRNAVVGSVLMEMITLAVLGLISGIVNGMLIVEMFSTKIMGVETNYPIGDLFFFGSLIVGLSLIAAIIPGMRASRIAPSQALRYTG